MFRIQENLVSQMSEIKNNCDINLQNAVSEQNIKIQELRTDVGIIEKKVVSI